MRITIGRGVDVVYDAVRERIRSAGFVGGALAVRGHLVSFWPGVGPARRTGTSAASRRNRSPVSRPNYGHYTDTPERLGPHMTRFFAALHAGIVSLTRGRRVISLERAADAHRDL